MQFTMKLFKFLFPIALALNTVTPALAQIEFIEATVQSVDQEARTFTIDAIERKQGGKIEGPLVARVSPGDVELQYEGRRIRGELGQSDGRFLLEFIWPVEPEQQRIMDAVNLQLQKDTATRQRRQFRKEGDYGINFSMFNEQGEIIQWKQFHGQWVVLNFIFTRCSVQEMCPAQTARMVDLQRRAAAEGIEDLQLVSITFDPEYDTPGILYDYGVTRGADLANFSFLTGPQSVMLNVLKQYGVIAFESENIIDHTVTTLLFDPTGKIVLRKDGTRWTVDQFTDHMLKAKLSRAAQPSPDAAQPTTPPEAALDAAQQQPVSDPEVSMVPILLSALIALLAIASGVILYSRRSGSKNAD